MVKHDGPRITIATDHAPGPPFCYAESSDVAGAAEIMVLDDVAPRREAIVASLTMPGTPSQLVTQVTSVGAALANLADAEVGVVLVASAEADAAPASIRALRAAIGSRTTRIVALASGPVDAAVLVEAGADDLVRAPIDEGELRLRVRAHLRAAETIAELADKERDAKAMLELTQTLSSSLEFSEILYTVVRRIAEVVNVDRVSIVLAPEAPASDAGEGAPSLSFGYVVAASDNQGITNLRIDLEKYPEIAHVLRTRQALTIHDAATHPVLEGVRGAVPQGVLGALTLLPIMWQEEAMGVLFLRAAPGRGALRTRETEFCQIAANATAVALRNARVMQTLRDQTQQVNFARFEAERRLRALKRYANLFTSAADGLVAVDQNGLLLFANPRAFEISGLTEADVRGKSLIQLLVLDDRLRMLRIWRGVKQTGSYPRDVDLRVQLGGEQGEVRTFNCSFSSLLEGDGAVLFSFRDVTKDRETARELAKTKEFLESLIDASVDAIIAADMHGRILLFNTGAEHIYGYSQDDVIGKMHVTELYPPGGARDVMRMLRSPSYGGHGRLEPIRFDAIDRDGKRVPITLSAAMILDENGHPYATVGIFTDLREKLKVEERLQQAQEKLALSEKSTLIAELAGTAAHELNQPLTSVMGYAELLLRKTTSGTPEHRAASVIVQEAERMAEIVRKVGKITRYETKTYVGAQKILDLDRAAGEDEKPT
jgi:PAS domain S-box-containing protein